MRIDSLVAFALLTAFGAAPGRADAQSTPTVTVSQDQLTVFARAWVAVAEVRDKAHAELADPRNKKLEDQARLREKLRTDIAIVLKTHGLTQAEFDRRTRAVSTDDALRQAFEAQLNELSSKKPPAGTTEAGP